MFGRTFVSGAIALGLLLAGPATAQDTAVQNVVVYDYAVSHPTEDAALPTAPTIGASVPQGVTLATAEQGGDVYGYFYYGGRPVIVDLETRSIVRIGD